MGAKSGSAQPQITITSLEYIEVLVAPKNLVLAFQEQSIQLFKVLDDLFEINQNLKKTRDLLIPQLVTGRRELK